jgi:hypothetical protein
MMPMCDLAGRRFGRLVAVRRAGVYADGSIQWLCRCECGNEAVVLGTNLRHGTSQSCGCLRNKLSSLRARRHGESHKPEYEAWHSMKQRCLNPRHRAFKNYGGRGIAVCPSWVGSFEAFFAYVGRKPHPALTLDRIDNDGDYEPGNVRWATWSQQNGNQRRRKP